MPGKAHSVELKFWPGRSFGTGYLSQPLYARKSLQKASHHHFTEGAPPPHSYTAMLRAGKRQRM